MAPPLAALGLDRAFGADVRRELATVAPAFADRIRTHVDEMVEKDR